MLPKLQPQIPTMHFLFTILLFNSFFFSLQQACNPRDQSSLLAFSARISTAASPPSNWSSNTNCCQWKGVNCDANGRVTHLRLPFKGLKGVISSSIGNLVSLTHLDFSNNDLYGPIPLEIGNLLHLKNLYLQNNSISGPIPSALMNCTNLIDIILRRNHLDGDISKLDFSRLVHLQKFDVADNNLRGKLPKTIYLCKSLIAIRVALNNLTGQMSPKIVKLKSLSFLSLTENSFMNIRKTLSILANCENLTYLFLGSNFRGESLPSHRNFLGSTGFPKLEFLVLSDCGLAGVFPEWISNLKTIRVLSLRENNIKEKIPEWIGTLPNLINLGLSGNHLFGEIPPSLCQSPALVSTNVYPKLILFHFDLPVFGYASSGEFVEFVTYYPSSLSLASNELSGCIPSEIGNLQNLQGLELGNNHFSGHIPVSLSNLKILEDLDLSENNLTGRIPKSFSGLHSLSSCNVSYNNLEGPIPTEGQFSTFNDSSFEGNPRLCGGILHRHCSNTATPKVKDCPLKGGSESKQLFVDGLWVGFTSGFSGILVVVASYFWFNMCMGQSPFLARG